MAIMYAAGRAMRLGAEFAELPKILIQFDNKTLLEWNTQRLSEIGVKRIGIVTGHKRELIQERFLELQDRYSVEFTEFFNPNYTEGSVLSVRVSLPGFEGSRTPVLLMDGDVLYSSEILRRLVQSRHPTALLIDRGYSTADDDPVLVPIRNGRPFEFLKQWKGDADEVGESVGFFKIDPTDIPLVVGETEKRATGERRRESYDEIIRALVLAGRFGHEDVTDVPWTEIDFPSDVELARKEIVPVIKAYDSNRA